MTSASRTNLFRTKLAAQLLSKSKGFTLIELLVVIVIVGVLSAVAVPTFLQQVQRSRFAEGERANASTATAATVYAFDCGSYGVGDYANLLSSLAACGNKGPWAEQAWSNLAPNYSVPTITGGTAGGRWTTGGNAGTPYASISCTKGVGALADGTADVCKRG